MPQKDWASNLCSSGARPPDPATRPQKSYPEYTRWDPPHPYNDRQDEPAVAEAEPSEETNALPQNTSNLMIRLHPLDLPKEKIDLVHPTSPGIPTRLLHRGPRSAKRKRRRKIPNIEPHLLPVDDLVTQLIGDVLGFLPLTKLQPSTPTTSIFDSLGWGFR